MSRDSLHKVILYNYLYEFSSLENKIKNKFKQILLEKDDEDIKNNFLLLHLSEEIKSSFTEDISNNAFQINRKFYKRNIDSVKIKWNLKKQLEFANKNNLLSDIMQKETISTYSFLLSSIQLRNKLAHETCDIKIKRDLELLSDDKLKELITGDDAFDELSDLAEIDTIYKQALTHYFYLKEIDEKLS